MKKVQRQALVDNLGRVIGVFRKGFHAPTKGGAVEYGQVLDGIRHIQGQGCVITVMLDHEDQYPAFDPADVAW